MKAIYTIYHIASWKSFVDLPIVAKTAVAIANSTTAYGTEGHPDQKTIKEEPTKAIAEITLPKGILYLETPYFPITTKAIGFVEKPKYPATTLSEIRP